MLSYTEQMRIAAEVTCDGVPPANESDEAKQFRTQISKEVADLKAKGQTPDLPFDWDADDEESEEDK